MIMPNFCSVCWTELPHCGRLIPVHRRKGQLEILTADDPDEEDPACICENCIREIKRFRFSDLASARPAAAEIFMPDYGDEEDEGEDIPF